jgi:hypothetical protein
LTASEAAFLIFGLVLGVASGATLIEVLRARPPASRHIRVTVAPNAIQGRLAATLSEPSASPDVHGPAAGGPGDRRFAEEASPLPVPVAEGRRLEDRRPVTTVSASPFDRTPVPSGSPVLPLGGPRRADVPGSAALAAAHAVPDEPAERPSPLWLRPAGGTSASGLVGVPISIEPDPITSALPATAAKTADAAMSSRRSGVAVAASDDPGPSPDDGATSASSAGSAATVDGPSNPASDGPCAEERRVADERCAVATRARERATAAAAELRRQQRAYDDLVERAEKAAATADPRAVRAAKEAAQQRFRTARGTAATRDDVEAGAREWLAEINRINHETREATMAAERDRALAAQLGPAL